MLTVAGLQAGYGRVQVVHGIDLAIGAGEALGLVGPNGSGRSTVARAIMGLVWRVGRVGYCGHELVALPTHRIARLGVGYVAEGIDAFADLSVADNLRLAGGDPAGRAGRLAELYRIFPALEARRRVAAGSLSGGEQRMLALARAVAGGPRLLVADEPTEGLAPAMVEAIRGLLRALLARGTAILLIEQRLEFVLELAPRVCVMDRGRIVFDGPAAALPGHAARPEG